MRLAIITPLPPQHTGIADYAADFIVGLNEQGLKIDLFSNADIRKFHDIDVYHVESINPDVLNDYDLIIYQMGNNIHFHLYMVDLIKKYRGVVHLHDLVLHHTFAWLTWAQNKPDEYFAGIEKWYGNGVADLAKKMVAEEKMPWNTEVVTDIPMFEEFIQYADACIVHSDFALNKIKSSFPKMEVYKVPQLYQMNLNCKKSEKAWIKFGVFGGVDPQKRVDIIIKCLGNITEKYGYKNYQLTIVGGIDEHCRYILDLPKKFNIEQNVIWTGRASDEVFKEHLAKIDILIALRYPTMGETSAVVMRAMQLGIPVIVNDIGWYHELPSFVKKIPVDCIEEKLESEIKSILEDSANLKKMSNEAEIFRNNHMNFDLYIQQYCKILDYFFRLKSNRVLFSQITTVMDDLNLIEDQNLSHKVVQKVFDIF